MTVPELAGHFEYLDDLRESGVTNMFGSVQFLQTYRGLSYDEGKAVLVQWMDSFNPNESPAIRAAAAMAKEPKS